MKRARGGEERWDRGREKQRWRRHKERVERRQREEEEEEDSERERGAKRGDATVLSPFMASGKERLERDDYRATTTLRRERGKKSSSRAMGERSIMHELVVQEEDPLPLLPRTMCHLVSLLLFFPQA